MNQPKQIQSRPTPLIYQPTGLSYHATLRDNIAAYWRLDENSGAAIDIHGGLNLTAVNNPLSTTGKQKKARNYVNASLQYHTANSDTRVQILPGESVTFALWCNIVSTAVSRRIVDKFNSSSGGDYLFSHSTTFTFGVSNAGGLINVSSAAISAGQWYFVVFGFNATTKKTFIRVNNGVQSNSAGTMVGDPLATARAFRFSQSGATTAFNGQIDEVGLWKRLLTDPEITALYNGGSGTTYPFLV